MNWAIIKDNVFEKIVKDKPVFVADPNEGVCKWANDMTVREIAEYLNKGVPFFTEQEAKQRYSLDDAVFENYIDVDKFTNLLHESGYTIDAFARATGVNKNTVHNVIRHKVKPKRKTLEAFCKALNVSEVDILE